MTTQTPPTIDELCSNAGDISIADCLSDNDNNFDDIKLTDFYSNEDEDVDIEIKRKIEEHKWFYLKNQNSYILALNKVSVYNKYKNENDFIGFKYKQLFNSETEIVILMTQIVNEREQMKSLGKILFYRELYLSTRKNESVQRMFNRYIGENEDIFSNREKKNIDFYRWKFLVHKRRFNYLKNLIEYDKGEMNLVSCLKNYNDVITCMKDIMKHNTP